MVYKLYPNKGVVFGVFLSLSVNNPASSVFCSAYDSSLLVLTGLNGTPRYGCFNSLC